MKDEDFFLKARYKEEIKGKVFYGQEPASGDYYHNVWSIILRV